MVRSGPAGGPVWEERDVTIKDSAESWVRSKPVLAMVAMAAVGLVVGGLVGLGVGYKIEKNRVQHDVQRLQNELKASGAATPNAKVAQRVGQVTGSSGSTLTVKTKLQGTQTITTTSQTVYEKTADAKTSDIAVGKKVLVAAGGHEVIILPDSSEIGHQVSKVSSDGFTVQGDKSRTANVKTKTVTKVYSLTTTGSTDAKENTDVIVAGKRQGAAFEALEVIVLPPDSGFAS
jgi:hypothetical protein